MVRIGEIRAAVDPIHGIEEPGILGPESVLDLIGRPQIACPFHRIDLRIERRIERPVVRAHLAQDELDDLARHLLVAALAGLAEGLGVDPREHGVVVEHDLKVRHEPLRIGRVAMEGAAEMVADAALGHGIERALEHGQDLARRSSGGAGGFGGSGAGVSSPSA